MTVVDFLLTLVAFSVINLTAVIILSSVFSCVNENLNFSTIKTSN